MIAWLVLAAACGLIAFQVWQDRRIFPRFVALDESADRRQALRSWTLDSFFRFGVLGVLGLVLLGAADALWQMPDGLAAAISSTFSMIGLGPGETLLLGWGLAGVLMIGLVAGAIAGARVDPETVPREGVGALLARNRKEARWTGLLSINAGLVEETFFRALLFIAVFQTTGSVVAAMLVSTVLFGLAHAYQGVAGVLTSGLLGFFFMVIYAATGALWLVILLHALIDLRGLVLLPWSLGWLSSEKETLR